YALLKPLIKDGSAEGLVLWAGDGSLIYPRLNEVAGLDVSPDHPLAEAWQLEFSKRQWAEAAAAYSVFTNSSDAPIAASALLGRSRCLSRSGKPSDALNDCQRAAFPNATDPSVRLIAEQARLFLLSLLQQLDASPEHRALYRQTLNALETDVFDASGARPPLPAAQNLF